MISTVTIARNTTARVAIEHPDEWDDDQIAEAAKNRAIDIAAAGMEWFADDAATVDGVEAGVDSREEESDSPAQAEPVVLTDEDLDAVPDPVVEDADEPAETE